MPPATSARDPRVVRAARLLRDPLARREEGAFVVDHPDLLEAARAAGLEVEVVLRAGEDAEDAMRAVAAVGQVPELAAIVRAPSPPPDDLPPRSLVLAAVAGAGNVGSIIRTAAAFGLPRVSLTPGCADPWSRPALRAALGASFQHDLVATGRPLRALAALPDRPPLAAALPRDGVPPAELPPGAAVVLGSEGEGLSRREQALCDLAVTIPAPGFESLNVAAAAAILASRL
jgi:TrmH family RNA methyltransferase